MAVGDFASLSPEPFECYGTREMMPLRREDGEAMEGRQIRSFFRSRRLRRAVLAVTASVFVVLVLATLAHRGSHGGSTVADFVISTTGADPRAEDYFDEAFFPAQQRTDAIFQRAPPSEIPAAAAATMTTGYGFGREEDVPRKMVVYGRQGGFGRAVLGDLGDWFSSLFRGELYPTAPPHPHEAERRPLQQQYHLRPLQMEPPTFRLVRTEPQDNYHLSQQLPGRTLIVHRSEPVSAVESPVVIANPDQIAASSNQATSTNQEEDASNENEEDTDEDDEEYPASTSIGSSPALVPRSMLRDMDTSVDPCEHFHEYSCGGFEQRARIPEDELEWSRAWDQVDDRNRKRLRRIIAADKGRVGQYYASCINLERINARGVHPLRPYLLNIDTIHSHDDLIDSIAALHSINVPTFFDWDVIGNPFRPGEHAFSLMQGGLTLPDQSYYLKPSMAHVRKGYLQVIQKFLERTGVPPSLALEEAQAALEIEIEISRSMTPRDQYRTALPRAHSIQDVDEIAPALNFGRFLVRLAGEQIASKIGRPVVEDNDDDDDDVAANSLNDGVADGNAGRGSATSNGKRENKNGLPPRAPRGANILYDNAGYFTAIGNLFSSRSLKDLRAYMRWRVTYILGADLGEDFLHLGMELNGILEGVSKQTTRWRKCMHSVTTAMPDAVGQLYIKHFFHESSRQTALTMLSQLRAIFRNRLLHDTPWMQPETRAAAVNKLDHMLFEVGYPSHWTKYKFAIDPDYFFETVVNARKEDVRSALLQMSKPIDRRRWGSTAVTDVDAFYARQVNTLFVPAGILQPPFFSPEYSAARNWGGIGVVLAHETSHALDDQGARFDQFGNLRNWWTKADKANFKERSQCVARQYSRYTLDGQHLDGNLTLGEAIADEGGVHLAYLAMVHGADELARTRQQPDSAGDVVRRAVEAAATSEHSATLIVAKNAQGQDPLAAAARVFGAIEKQAVNAVQQHAGGFGASLQEKQLFFLSWGQTWCSITRPRARTLKLLTDEHAPDKFRIIGPLSQMPAFAAAFSCPLGSEMHPYDTCQLW